MELLGRVCVALGISLVLTLLLLVLYQDDAQQAGTAAMAQASSTAATGVSAPATAVSTP